MSLLISRLVPSLGARTLVSGVLYVVGTWLRASQMGLGSEFAEGVRAIVRVVTGRLLPEGW